MSGWVNWTMLPRLGEIWQQMIDRVLPALPELPKEGQSPKGEIGGGEGRPGGTSEGRRPVAVQRAVRRQVFTDLADPEKRTAEDLRGALEQCSAMSRYADVTLAMNLKESVQVAEALGIDPTDDPESAIEPLARAIRGSLDGLQSGRSGSSSVLGSAKGAHSERVC